MKEEKLNQVKPKKIFSWSLFIGMVIAMISTSMFIYASGEPVETYAGDLTNGTGKGYVNATFEFGSFPQSKVDNPDALGLTTDVSVQTVGSDRYVYQYDENNYEDAWFKFEPITWRILKVEDDGSGNGKVVAISNKIIDARIWTSFDGDDGDDYENYLPVRWDKTRSGYEEPGKNFYPTIRLYLNSYDSSNGYSHTDSDSSSSNLVYTPSTAGTSFYDIGFLEKAFTSAERNAILNDVNEYFDPELDGLKENMKNGNNENGGNYDKVRLLSVKETYDDEDNDHIGSKYGFASDKYEWDYDESYLEWYTPHEMTHNTNRLAVITDYALTNYQFLYDTSLNTYEIGDCASWWTLSSEFVDDYYAVAHDIYRYGHVDYDEGTSFAADEYSKNGVRPVISLPLSYFEDNDITIDAKAWARSGSDFVKWTDDGVDAGTEITKTGLEVSNLQKLKAIFEVKPFCITPDGKEYFEGDELYKWDIGNTANKIFAYYYNGDTNKNGSETARHYDGEFLIVQDGTTTNTKEFKNAAWFDEDSNTVKTYEGDLTSEFDAIASQVLSGNISYTSQGGTTYTFTPWSVLNAKGRKDGSEQLVKSISFGTTTYVKVGNYFFAGLNNLDSIDISLLKDSNNTSINYKNCFRNVCVDSLTIPSTFVSKGGTFESAFQDASFNELNFSTGFAKTVNNVDHAFDGITITELQIPSNFGNTNVRLTTGVFQNSHVNKITFGEGSFAKAVTMKSFFEGSDVETITVSSDFADTVIDFHAMFKDCSNLKRFNDSNLTDGKDWIIFPQNFGVTSNQLSGLTHTAYKSYNGVDLGSMFENCTQIQKINYSNLSTDALWKIHDNTNVFEGCTRLDEINLPPSSVDTTNAITLPSSLGYCWEGFNGTTDKGISFTTLPARNTNSNGVYSLKLIESSIEAGGKSYKPSDALYKWDISKDGDGSIMAYYFDGNKNIDGESTSRTYDGEMIIYSSSPSSVAVTFDCAYRSNDRIIGDYSDNESPTNPQSGKTVDDYLTEKGFLNVDGYNFTPWSILQNVKNKDINEVYISNAFKINSGNVLFCGLNEITTLDVSNIDMTNATSLEYAFGYLDNVISINFDVTTTSDLKNMCEMFVGCKSLTTLTFGENIDTTGVSKMRNVFEDCQSLTSLDLSEFGFDSVYYMDYMFNNCIKLERITFPETVNSNYLYNMSYMFTNCFKLNDVGFISKFNTSKVTDIRSMFFNCVSLTEIDLSHNDLSKVSNPYFCFGCINNLIEFIEYQQGIIVNEDELTDEDRNDYGDWYDSELKVPYESKLEHIYFNDAQTIKPSYGYEGIFFGLHNLEDLDLSTFCFDARKLSPYSWAHLDSLKSITLPKKTSLATVEITLPTYEDSCWTGYKNGTKVGGQYTNLPFNYNDAGDIDEVRLESSLIEVGEGANKKVYRPSDALYTWDISKDGDGSILAYYFDGNKKKDGVTSTLRTYDGEVVIVSNSQTAEMITFEDACVSEFYDAESMVWNRPGSETPYSPISGKTVDDYLTERGFVEIGGYETYTPWSILQQVKGKDIKEINISDKFKVTNGKYLFDGLNKVTSLDLKKIDFTSCSSLNNAFSNMASLTSIDLDVTTTSTLKDLNFMFDYDKALVTVTFGDNFNTSGVTTMLKTFDLCSSLTNLNLAMFDFSDVQTMNGMFSDCKKLESITFAETINSEDLTDMSYAFNNCQKLSDVSFISKFDTSSVTNVEGMFINCANLEEINLSDNDFSSVTNAKWWFTTLNDFAEYAKWNYGYADINNLTPEQEAQLENNRDSYNDTYKLPTGVDESKLEHIYFNPNKTITFNYVSNSDYYSYGFNKTFFGLHNLKDLDLSSFNFVSFNSEGDDFYHDYDLGSITLPTKTTDDTVEVTLPIVPDSYWTGYKDEEKVGGTYTKLPFNYNDAGEIDEVRLESSLIKINEGTPKEKVYRPSDATYAWDISDDGITGKVMAYYFAEDSSKGYDGELIFWSSDPSNKNMYFDYYGWLDGSDYKLNNTSINDSNYVSYLTDNNFRKLTNNKSIKPWDVLVCFGRNTNKIKHVYIANEFVFSEPLSTDNKFFEYMIDVTSFDVSKLNVSEIENINRMFNTCTSLESIDLSSWNLANVKEMNQVFGGCTNLETVDFGEDFYLPNVVEMDYIFGGCTNLGGGEVFDISAIRTSDSLRSLEEMFEDCTNLVGVDFGDGFDTSKLELVDMLFYGCTNLETADLSFIDTTYVYYYWGLFYNCENLESVDLSGWKLFGERDWESAFYPISHYNYYYGDIFTGCTSLTSIKVPASVDDLVKEDLPFDADHKWEGYKNNSLVGGTYKTLPDTEGGTIDEIRLASNNITIGTKTYKPSDALYTWDVSFSGDGSIYAYYFDGDKKKDGETSTLRTYDGEVLIVPSSSNACLNIFSIGTNKYSDGNYITVDNGIRIDETNYESYLTENGLRQLGTNHYSYTPWNILDAFSSDHRVKSIIASDTFKITSGANLFEYLPDLSYLDISKVDTSENISTNSMFLGDKKLNVMDLSMLDFSNVADFTSMFMQCVNLETLTLPDEFVTSSATTLDNMFYGCYRLGSINFESFDTSNVDSYMMMLGNCVCLDDIDISNFVFKDSNVNLLCMFAFVPNVHDYMYLVIWYENPDITLELFDANIWEEPTEEQNAKLVDMYFMGELPPQPSALTKVTFPESTIKTNNTAFMFLNQDKLEKLDLSKFEFNDASFVSNMLYGADSLTEVKVPSALNDSLDITLPEITDNYWMGDDGNAYTKLKQKSGDLTKVELKSSLIKINEGTPQEKVYRPSEAIYTWDISDGKKGTIFAYYFETGVTNSDGVKEGELIFQSLNDTDKTFNIGSSDGYAGYEYGSLKTHSNYDKLKTADEDSSDPRYYKTVLGEKHGFYYPDDSGNKTIPWQLLETWDSEHTITKVIFANDINLNQESRNYFAYLPNLKGFEGIEHLMVDNVNYFYSMFAYDLALETVDLTHFNTESANALGGMFMGDNLIDGLDFRGFDTSSVDNFDYMFYDCQNLADLKLPNNFVSNSYTSSFESMFENCLNLVEVNLSGWNTEYLENVENMFKNCTSLNEIDLNGYDLHPVWKTDDMLEGCSSLNKIILPNVLADEDIILSNPPTDYIWMGNDGSGPYTVLPKSDGDLTYIYLKSSLIKINEGTPEEKVYKPSEALYTWDISTDGSKAVMAYFFDGKKDKDGNSYSREYKGELVFYTFNDNKTVIPFNDFAYLMSGEKWVGYGMYPESFDQRYGQMETILQDRNFIHGGYYVITPWSALLSDDGISPVKEVVIANKLNLTSGRDFFAGLSSLEKITGIENINTDNLDLSNTSNMEKMFFDCCKLDGTLDLSSLDLTNAKSMNMMFTNCYVLDGIIFDEDTTISIVTDMNSMFKYCKELGTIDLSMFNTSSTYSMQYMFSGCENLGSVTFGSNFVTSSVSDMTEMFANCKALTSLDLSGFDISASSVTDFIKGTDSLALIKLPNSMTTTKTIQLVAGDKSYWMGYDDSSKPYGKLNKLMEKSSDGKLTVAKLVHDETAPTVTKVESDKNSYGANKDITLRVTISEELDTSNFADINKDNFYIKLTIGNKEAILKYETHELDTVTGDFVLVFKGKTPDITDEGEFKVTKVELINNGEEVNDYAGNELDVSSLDKNDWKDTLNNLVVNTTGFPISITARDHQGATISNLGITSDDKIYFDIDFSDYTLSPSKTLEEILECFTLEITNKNSSKILKNQSLTLKEVKDGSYPFAVVTEDQFVQNKYKVTVDLSDDGSGTHFIEKDDYLGYSVKVSIPQKVLDTDTSKNIAASHELTVKRLMEEGSITAKLQRDDMPDKELIYNKQKQRFEDGNGNEVKFQNGDKIVINSPSGSKITYKEDGDDKETPSNELVITIDTSSSAPVYEEIGSYKEGCSINPSDLKKLTINFVKLIIKEEGNGGNVTPLGELDIDSDSKEITITVDEDYKADIYKGSSLTKTLNESGSYLVDGLKNLFNDLTVKVKFVSTKKPEPTPPGGGGGGGGGAPAGPVYTIIPDELPKSTHKAYMNGYEDHTFRPQNSITREEVATIVARLHDEFNEDYNFTSFNSFGDADDRWSKNYIGFCKMKDLIHGYEDGSFHPTSVMTRAELATLVNNFLRVQNADYGKIDLTKPAFSDVDGRWYEESVNKLAHLGILNGYEDGTFKGDNPVSRIEVAIVMNKVNHRNVTTEIPDEYKIKVTQMFKDVTKDRWFFNDVAEAAVDHPNDLY